MTEWQEGYTEGKMDTINRLIDWLNDNCDVFNEEGYNALADELGEIQEE